MFQRNHGVVRKVIYTYNLLNFDHMHDKFFFEISTLYNNIGLQTIAEFAH